MGGPDRWGRGPTVAGVFRARALLRHYLTPTPLREYPGLSELVGTRVLIKHENLNPTCAFKVRGGINLLSQLSPEERRSGVITASSGNHGQSIAYASSLFDVPATVYLPEDPNPDKARAIEQFGARLVCHGKDFDESREEAERVAAKRGARYIHNADEPLLIEGVGTIGLEIMEAQPDVDVLVIPVGGGTGAVGSGMVAKALARCVRVYAVQAAGAPSVYRSYKAGRILPEKELRTFAEGLATRVPFPRIFRLIRRILDDFFLVTEEEMREAVRLLVRHAHTLAEGAGAAPLAAALKLKRRLRGKTVALVLSGANLPSEVLRDILCEDEATSGGPRRRAGTAARSR
jgi:threonine dehydratase